MAPAHQLAFEEPPPLPSPGPTLPPSGSATAVSQMRVPPHRRMAERPTKDAAEARPKEERPPDRPEPEGRPPERPGAPEPPTSSKGDRRGTPPVVVSLPAPAYPDECRHRGHHGVAVVLVRVVREGGPAEVRIERSAGCPRLDAAAVEAARRGRYRPERRDGEAVETWLRVPFSFSAG